MDEERMMLLIRQALIERIAKEGNPTRRDAFQEVLDYINGIIQGFNPK